MFKDVSLEEFISLHEVIFLFFQGNMLTQWIPGNHNQLSANFHYSAAHYAACSVFQTVTAADYH